MDTEQWSLNANPPLPPCTQSTHPIIPQDPVQQQQPQQRFPCTFPGCEKKFSRREHLTRHTKTHDPQPQYRCHICGRRYVRSDVLKRHVKFHPAFESKSAEPEPILSSSEGGDPGAMETTATIDPEQQTWDQLNQGLWSFSPPSPLPYEQDDEAIMPNHNNQLAPNKDTTFVYGQAHHESPFLIPHLDPIDIDTSTNTSTSSVPFQGWDFMESPPTSMAPSNVFAGLNKAVLGKGETIDTYFAKVHPFWPIFHAPSFKVDETSDILLASMTMLVNWLEGGSEHCQWYTNIFETATASHVLMNPSLHALQALFLCVSYATYRLSEKGMATWAVRLNSILISTCRCVGVFSDETTSAHELNDNPLAVWLAREHLHRLAFSVFRIDTYLSLMLDHPPSLRYEELCIPLPKSSQLWEAASDADRRRLQWEEPAGRDKAMFSYLMRDAVCGEQLPCRLTKDDFHMTLLGLQSGVWEAAREAHSFASGVLDVKLTPGAPILMWRARLEQWQRHMEEDASIQKDYFSDAPSHFGDTVDILSPVTLLVLHIASLKMHAPLGILQVSPNSYRERARHATLAPPTANSQARLKVWRSSSCPRIAVWNAAQIARVASRELRKVTLNAGPARLCNPLVLPGLLMSAVVIYSYVQYTSACDSCANSASGGGGQANPSRLDLDMVADPNEQGFIAWKDGGLGLATFGAERIPLCKCKMAEITARFERLLAIDSLAKNVFLAFTREASTPIT
ncbi:hypothetical protein PG990_006476 [Apiospora arundinis]|uniref:Fungal transcriptional regulatory protein N-terminal n=1 Tax=Apiospora arundinis TaxID=335852 RepID=A0ABR2JAQ4_9PEZI